MDAQNRIHRGRVTLFLCTLLLSIGCGSNSDLDERSPDFSHEIDQSNAEASGNHKHGHDPYSNNNKPLLMNNPEDFVYRGQLSKNELTTFRQATQQKVKVLELKYFPIDPQGNIDKSAVGNMDASYENKKIEVDGFSKDLVKKLTLGSQSLKSGSQPYLLYEILESKEFKKAVGNRYYEDQRNKSYYADHESMFEADVDVCYYVDKLGVRDVWVWMYHNDSGEANLKYKVTPIESNMSMGRISQQFFTHPTHGDVSNSYILNDLPICNYTYVVYQFNYFRGVAEALHNYGHQRERIYRWLNYALWSNKFERPYGEADQRNSCGNVHYPPNSEFGYDYKNKRKVSTFCSNWNPKMDGNAEDVSCEAWGCTHDGYLVWWNRRIPGFGNDLKDDARTLRNYHELFADFDKAIAISPSIYSLPIQVDESANFQISCPKFWASRCSILKAETNATTGLCRHLLVPRGDDLPPPSANSASYSGGTSKHVDSCIADETLNLNQIPTDTGILFDFYVLFNAEPILKIAP